MKCPVCNNEMEKGKSTFTSMQGLGQMILSFTSDEEAKFKWISSEILSLNKEGAKVRVKAQIDFIKYHYETECTVRWNENLSGTKIKNASITAV